MDYAVLANGRLYFDSSFSSETAAQAFAAQYGGLVLPLYPITPPPLVEQPNDQP